MNDFYPEKFARNFARSFSMGDLPIIIEGSGFASAEGLRLELAKVGGKAEVELVTESPIAVG